MSYYSQLNISTKNLILIFSILIITVFYIIINTKLYYQDPSKYFYYNDTGHKIDWSSVSRDRVNPDTEKYVEENTFQEDLGFQPVSDDGLYVYSVFFGNQNTRKLIIIGIDKSIKKRKLLCEFYQNSTSVLPNSQTNATKRNSADGYNTGLKYCPIFIDCDIPEEIQHPNYVSINTIDTPSNYSRNLLKVHDTPEFPIYNISACLQPIYTNENVTTINPLRLIEWLEFQLMMGVQHFTFYNISANPIISKVLKSYKEVSILPWNIPFILPNEIRARGQFIQANDCSHRHRGISRFFLYYVANGSKFIVTTLRHEFSRGANYDKFHSEPTVLLLGTKITPIPKNLQPTRAKFVQLPENVVESGVHFVMEGVPGSRQYVAERNFGRYLHFRECTEFFQKRNPTLPNNQTCNPGASFVENFDAVDRFAEKIVTRVDKKGYILIAMTLRKELFAFALVVALIISLGTTTACFSEHRNDFQHRGIGAMVTKSVDLKCTGGSHYSKHLGRCVTSENFGRNMVG
ncbi:uncharacterized protein LOC110857308 isoform X2 [Folsomia candida]|uniref:uncharacterized protein LOC110857308 isoform X2 n=1 Tax=Folsomia candida TaxID=158441 RepID=UPI001604A68A|nr:uncharacterized protein LOC110857308 isoform X2 [Folsomia candida]